MSRFSFADAHNSLNNEEREGIIFILQLASEVCTEQTEKKPFHSISSATAYTFSSAIFFICTLNWTYYIIIHMACKTQLNTASIIQTRLNLLSFFLIQILMLHYLKTYVLRDLICTCSWQAFGNFNNFLWVFMEVTEFK